MFEAIGSNGGIVTLMIGDGLMAAFGAPQPVDKPAQCAVSAALDMFSMMAELNSDRAALDTPEIRLGVGIATGEVVAGYAGTDQRATHTCIGNTVNLAARPEAHTKVARCDILMDRETRSALEHADQVREIEAVRFDGFSEATYVFFRTRARVLTLLKGCAKFWRSIVLIYHNKKTLVRDQSAWLLSDMPSQKP